MVVERYIGSSCVISSNVVLKDGKPIFENPNANVQEFLLSVYQNLDINYPRFYKMDNQCKLGLLASELLLRGIPRGEFAENTGVVLYNANSSIDTDINYLLSTNDIPSPSLFVYTLPNIVTGEICIRNKFKGENAFFISEHFDAAAMLQYVGTLFDGNLLTTCICGWVDVYEEEHKAVLFLINNDETGIPFTKEHINSIFKTEQA